MRKNLQMERSLINDFIKLLKGVCEIDKVETTTTNGFSDLVYSCKLKGSKTLGPLSAKGRSGFIEAKYKLDWPRRETTKVTFNHYTKEQKLFLYRHGKAVCGSAFLLVQVNGTVMIFDWLTAQKVGTFTKCEMLNNCLYAYNSKFKPATRDFIRSMVVNILLSY